MFFFFFFEEDRERYKPGTVCRVIGDERKEGMEVVIHQVYSRPNGLSLWCYENKPVRYRINQRGEKVIDFDPACVMSPYSPENLELTEEIPVQDGGWGARYRHGRTWR